MAKKQQGPNPEPPAVYSFRNKSRCPRCGSLNTEAYRTDGEIQYRRCKSAPCRRSYKELGTPV